MQGDIIAILNDSGECVAEYEYDAWGNCTVTNDTDTIAYDNPLRYRGYYYDFDTGFYYLQSRYYDANTGRFINADEPALIGANGGMVSNNLFAYCYNNPVNYVDYSGMLPTRTSSYSRKYNRTAVLNYIRMWCYSRNSNFVDCGKDYDCTNFVSQCLYAGGLPMYYHWMCVKNRYSNGFRYTSTWTMAESLFDHVQTYLSTVTTYSATKYSQVENIIPKIESGDLLFFYKYSEKKITHAAIISRIHNKIVYYGQHSDDAHFKNLKTRMSNKVYKVYIVHLSTYVKWRNY